MRLTELLKPPQPIPKKTSESTVAEVFIIESLSLIDERKNRHEGEVLADVLRMCGKNPLYYYIRTRAELVALVEEFAASRYRYLHLSCHGGEMELETTLDEISYIEFAQIFEGQLRRRRLFASACGVGNEMFAELLGARNEEMYSVAGPTGTMQFDHAVAFWSAFYVKAFSINSKSMKTKQVAEIIQSLATLFGAPFHLSSKSKSAWKHQVIAPASATSAASIEAKHGPSDDD